MRTTITIDEDLYREVKAQAARRSQSVSQLIEDALREAVRPPSRSAKRVRLPTFGGTGTMPGVDLTDLASLADLTDQGEGLDALR